MCARVRFCVSVSQTGLVVHAARWSYVNRAVSHLLWPGWESSGGPGSLWVPDLHVIHSWGEGTGLEWGEYKSAQIQTGKIEKGKLGREEGGWSMSEGRLVRLRGLAACAVEEFGYDERRDELDEFWLPLSHCHSNHHGGFIPPAPLASLFSPRAFPSYVASPSHLLTALIGMNQFLKL